MLEQLEAKIKDAMHKEMKNEAYARSLEKIDMLVNTLQKSKPNINIDSLVDRLTEVAERAADESATRSLAFQEETARIVAEEMAMVQQQVKVAA